MATKQRSRQRRAPRSSPRYVAPVLDPTWHSPYAPSTAERHAHHAVVRAFTFRRRLPRAIAVGIVVAALVAGVVVVPWLPAVGAVIALAYAWDFRRSLVADARRGRSIGPTLRARLAPGGGGVDQVRLATVLDRLAATFGVDRAAPLVVSDPGYNAALVPDEPGLTLIATDALMRDFELIELEGVVAHCLARARLGQMERESLAAVVSATPEARRALAGEGLTYRADEVAGAAIRYPLGIAAALRKCAGQAPSPDSYFTSPDYDVQRWVWFDVAADRREPDLSDLDDPTLRATALEEW
ncbi:MAG TPA: hypothetical protein VGS61_05870 [Acidimicrobiales bacterium]|nr:hypothetical protein [Acidimicrobiales bacterium]